MSIQFRSFALVSLSLLAFACGDEEDPNAQDKCETFVKSYCDRVVSCAQSEGLFNASFTAADWREECELSFDTETFCGEAVRVSSSYNQCISDVKSYSCDALNAVLTDGADAPIPTSCNQVILRDAE